MNFSFDINDVLPFKITKFTSDLKMIDPCSEDQDPTAYRLTREMTQRLAVIVDKMGDASSKAQRLRDTITSFRKLTCNSTYRIYLMKDASLNDERGSVVGLLKVGEKRLFVYDNSDKSHEIVPLCVLDFYVCESEQRKGYGKQLFDCMLKSEGVQRVEHLAIDSPSDKSLAFLSKHYALRHAIPQRNSFIIYPGFLANRASTKQSTSRPVQQQLQPLQLRPQQQQQLQRLSQPQPQQQQQQQQSQQVQRVQSTQQQTQQQRYQNSMTSHNQQFIANFYAEHFPALAPANALKTNNMGGRTRISSSTYGLSSYNTDSYVNDKYRKTRLW